MTDLEMLQKVLSKFKQSFKIEYNEGSILLILRIYNNEIEEADSVMFTFDESGSALCAGTKIKRDV